jgi:hypothetical protein
MLALLSSDSRVTIKAVTRLQDCCKAIYDYEHRRNLYVVVVRVTS